MVITDPLIHLFVFVTIYSVCVKNMSPLMKHCMHPFCLVEIYFAIRPDIIYIITLIIVIIVSSLRQSAVFSCIS